MEKSEGFYHEKSYPNDISVSDDCDPTWVIADLVQVWQNFSLLKALFQF
jgi:hypothetical protein